MYVSGCTVDAIHKPSRSMGGSFGPIAAYRYRVKYDRSVVADIMRAKVWRFRCTDGNRDPKT
jgi:hypothetical protein